MSPPTERVLSLIEALLRAETPEAVVQAGAKSIGEISEAPLTGVVVLIHGRVFLESWFPVHPPRARDPFRDVRAMAVQTAQNGTAAFMPLDGAGVSMMAHALHLPLGHRLSGSVCTVSAGAELPLDRLAGVLTLRLNELLELEAERRKSQQFERWFRVSDRQIRALDLERQKFAALVNSFAGGAFVADRQGIISWQTRPLLNRTGSPGDSWVGRPCRELCESIGGRAACGQCLVARVLAQRQPASCDIMVGETGEDRVTRAVAAPINDLAGQAQEVIVTFQDVIPIERKAA